MREHPDSNRYGTVIKLGVVRPQRDMAGVDLTQCRLLSCRDDKGTNLARQTVPGLISTFPCQSFDQMWHDDRAATALTLWFPDGPADNASEIILDGRLVLLCGSGRRVTEIKDLPISADGELGTRDVQIGPMTLALSGYGNTDGRLTVRLSQHEVDSLEQSVAKLDEIHFFDESGKEVPGRRSGGPCTVTPRGQVQDGKDWDLERRPHRLTMRITYFDMLTPVTVPYHARHPTPRVPTGPLEKTRPEVDRFRSPVRMELGSECLQWHEKGVLAE